MSLPFWLRSLARTLGSRTLSSCRRRREGAPRRRTAFRCAVEQLEDRLVPSALVTTDRSDYPPSSTAIFTAWNDANAGTNFLVGETVRFHIDRTDGVPVSAPPAIQDWNVTDGVGGFTPHQDANGVWCFPDTDGAVDGNIATTWFVDPQFAGASLELTATGQTSGGKATCDFTDSNVKAGMQSTYSGTDTATVNWTTYDPSGAINTLKSGSAKIGTTTNLNLAGGNPGSRVVITAPSF